VPVTSSCRLTSAGLLAHSRRDLIAEKDPPPPQLVPWKQAAPGVFKDRRDRQVKQLGDVAPIEHIVAGEWSAVWKHDQSSHRARRTNLSRVNERETPIPAKKFRSARPHFTADRAQPKLTTPLSTKTPPPKNGPSNAPRLPLPLRSYNGPPLPSATAPPK